MPGGLPAKKSEPRKLLRVILLFLGIVLGQLILFGPSLIGRKILLPLDLLAGEGFYLPRTSEISKIQPKDGSVADMILAFEPARHFAISEFRAGRLPTWTPYDYAGAPFIWPKFSPFLLSQCCFHSPSVLAWSQLLVALVAGVGAYLFFRSSLKIGFWPAAICAWCYPLTGFFVVWQGFFTVLSVCWLPWLLLAVDQTVRGGRPLAPISMAAVTTLVVVSGQLDVAGQVLLASGLYALWRIFEEYYKGDAGLKNDSPTEALPVSLRRFLQIPWRAKRVVASLAAAWSLGLLLATPYLLPVLEYTHTGARMARRGTGAEERPPVGLKALPQIVLPNIYGTTQQPSLRYSGGSPQQESSAGAFAGLLTTLLIAPLAFCSRRHRSSSILLALMSVFACSWCLNLPGVVAVLRLPGLNMMSHNRLVFLACFSTLALAGIGLEVLLVEQPLRWRKWMWLPVVFLGGLCSWAAYRTGHLPEPVATKIALTVSQGGRADWIHDVDDVKRLQAWFTQNYASSAVWCGVGVLGWIILRGRRLKQSQFVALIGILMFGELLWFDYGRAVQSDPALYYPPIPVLQSLAKAFPGRVMGFGCLPATLSSMCGLRDIRGYDAVDPARLVDLVMSTAEPISRKPAYAVTMQLAPKATITPAGDIQLPPVLDMLNVRYVIFRGSPFPKTHPFLQGFDYWVLENPRALPRAFVPESVEMITNDAIRLQKIESPDFKPRAVAYVESAVVLPASCRGTAEITDEIPTRINVSVHMETAGLVVLADLWDKGWHAYLDGKPVPILRADHAIRGVVVSAGVQSLQFRYEPASFAWGLRLAAMAALILLGWTGVCLWNGHKRAATLVSAAEAPDAEPAG